MSHEELVRTEEPTAFVEEDKNGSGEVMWAYIYRKVKVFKGVCPHCRQDIAPYEPDKKKPLGAGQTAADAWTSAARHLNLIR